MLKAGDRVRRIICSNSEGSIYFNVGELGTIIEDTNGSNLDLVRVRLDKNNHEMKCSPQYLEKVEERVSTNKYNVVETVPEKKQIKTKDYVIAHRSVYVRRANKNVVNITFGGNDWNQKQLRETAILFYELADALEEGNG